MRKIALFLIITLIVSCKEKKSGEVITAKPIEVSDNELVNYIKYCNDRFDICILYPSNFTPLPEPINGDGRTFTDTPDKAEITVYGSIINDNYKLEDNLNEIKSYVDVSDVSDLPNGFEVLGTEKDSDLIHHEITIIKEEKQQNNTIKVLHNLIFTYPSSKEGKFNSYWDIISQEIKK